MTTEVVLDDNREVVLANATVTASSSVLVTSYGGKEVVLFINVSGSVTGTTPTLTFTIQEVDPGDELTTLGVSTTGAVITATGTQILTLPVSRSSFFKISWVVTGSSPVFNNVYATLVNKGAGASVLYDNLGNSVFGTAGSPGTAVLTVQGVAGGTPSPVSGTVTANQGTANTLANKWPVQHTDGTNVQPTMDAVARKAFVSLTDGTNGPAAVKPASTAAVATDPALVVAISPNNSITTSSAPPSDRQATGTITALNGAVSISTQGVGNVGVTITGTWTATLTFQGTIDGTNWFAVQAMPLPITSSSTTSSTTAANAQFTVPASGLAQFRVIATAFTSGTATVTLEGNQSSATATGVHTVQQATAANLNATVVQGAGSGAAGTFWYVRVTDGTNTMPTGDAVARSIFHQITDGTRGPVTVKAASTAAVAADLALVVALSPNDSLVAQSLSDSYPTPDAIAGTPASLNVDPFGNLSIRGPVLTDEGSLRDHFVGSSLTTTLTGTATFTNGSTNVTGSGTTFTTQVLVGQYVKLSADSETAYAQVASIQSSTQLTLVTTYTGSSSGAAAVVSNWATTTGSGGSFTVASSIVSIVNGLGNGTTTYLRRKIDYAPLACSILASFASGVANQVAFAGLMDVPGAPTQQAIVQWDGALPTNQVRFITSAATGAAETQTTLVTLPIGLVVTQELEYLITLTITSATLIIRAPNQFAAFSQTTSELHIPLPYTVMSAVAGLTNNAAVGSSATLNVDTIFLNNSDRLEIANSFTGEPVPTFPNNTGTPRAKDLPTTVGLVGGTDGLNLYPLRSFATRTAQSDQRYNLLEYAFDQTDTTIDTNALTTTLANGGTVTQGSGLGTLATNTTANGSAILFTDWVAQLQPGSTNEFQAYVQTNTGVANNVRRWGVFDANNGYFFILNGTTLQFGVRKNGSDTTTAIATAVFALDTNFHDYVILYDGLRVTALVDDVVVYQTGANVAAVPTFSDQLTARFESTNSASLATNQTLAIRSFSVNAYGVAARRGRYFRFTQGFGGGTSVIKRGPGRLRAVMQNNSAFGVTVTVYDNTAASGAVILQLQAGVISNLAMDTEFTTGLTATCGGGCEVSFFYD